MLDAEDDEYLAKIRNKSNKKKIIAKNREHLKVLIAEEIKKNGPNCSLNHIDVSKITDMSYVFYKSKFNGDISKWDVSNVTDMCAMFSYSEFIGDISNWNLNDIDWDDLEFPEDSCMYKKLNVLNRKKMVKDI